MFLHEYYAETREEEAAPIGRLFIRKLKLITLIFNEFQSPHPANRALLRGEQCIILLLLSPYGNW